LVGLDIHAKARMFEQQVRRYLAPNISKFTLLAFQLLGVPVRDAQSQNAATATLRIIAQAPRADDLASAKFVRPLFDLIMAAYPGGTVHMDGRWGTPRPVFEFFVTKMEQKDVKQQVHLEDTKGTVVEVPPPVVTRIFPARQPSTPSFSEGATRDFGGTVRAPLGLVVHARSGDKGSDSNVGFFVANEEQFQWLRRLLSVDKVKALLASEYNGKEIDRFEFPNIRAVHFLLHDHLDRGVSCTSTVDFLGKNVAEFLRAREVDVPRRFLGSRSDGVSGKL